jgi:hypothetical protein
VFHEFCINFVSYVFTWKPLQGDVTNINFSLNCAVFNDFKSEERGGGTSEILYSLAADVIVTVMVLQYWDQYKWLFFS